jgi:hypothetical protein
MSLEKERTNNEHTHQALHNLKAVLVRREKEMSKEVHSYKRSRAKKLT